MIVRLVNAIDLFTTPEFRGSEWIRKLCAQVDTIWITEQSMPPGHFGTYFGATQFRSYDNRYVADLYWLHELTHVRTLTYDPSRTWLQWSKGVIASELEASLVSECYAYVRIPGIRAKTFPHEIWADRFLKRLTPSVDPVEIEAEIRAARLHALHAPAFDDFLEAQLANYYRQNHDWCRIWAGDVTTGPKPEKPAFRVVEEHMASDERDKTHQAWIDAHSRIGDWNAPFLQQGKAFAEIYKASNARFGNWLLSR